jgi:hypothetical protein
MECTQELLNNYSYEHFTFINQIFGDATVREIITKIFRNNKYAFYVEVVPEHGDFDEGFHHILVNKKNHEETLYCSVDRKHQFLKKNVNDTFCQSYTLLKYLNRPLDEIYDDKSLKSNEKMYMVHREMIKMYRHILSNKRFIKEFNSIDFVNTFNEDGRTKTFRNFTRKGHPALNMTSEKILVKIEDTLKKWETYGYWHYIGTGKCHKGRLIYPLDVKISRMNNKTRKNLK